MATTEAAPAKPDFDTEIEQAQHQLQEAREERGRLGQEHRDWMTRVAGMAAELDVMAKDRPELFGLDGHPKTPERRGQVEDRVAGRGVVPLATGDRRSR